MIDTLAVLPLQFWVVCFLLAIGFFWSAKTTKQGIGIPSAAVLATILVWYLGDVLYNDYRAIHMRLFTPEVLSEAWWQVAVFLIAFLLLTPMLHKRINKLYLGRGSRVLLIKKLGVNNPTFQNGLTILFRSGIFIWCALLIGAVFRFRGDVIYYLFPFLGKHSGPWLTSSIGGGANSFLALANYLQLMIGALFGVVAALSTNSRIRKLAFLMICLTWPHYIFHRTRKFILVVVLPGILAWVFLRMRGGKLKKTVYVLTAFVLINAWFGFVISQRQTSSITTAFIEKGFDIPVSSIQEHQGLNMYEELSWIVRLTSSGRFEPGMGENYFANLVNPIPRSVWAGKPTIGLDYAKARGLGNTRYAVGVYGTLSHGVIGQGVVNFGLYVGPAFAALLMSLWAVCLARLDLRGYKIGYIPLYGLGLTLTFTMGRDITFLELYPFVFGYLICWWLNKHSSYRSHLERV